MMNMQYDELVNLIKEDPSTAIGKYSLKYKEPREEVITVEIMIRKELRELMIDHIPKEEQESLMDITEVSDISEVEVVDIYEDDHLPCTVIVFNDQDERLRQTMIGWDNDVPGMVKYYEDSINIKKDLIEKINLTYKFAREDNEEELEIIKG